MPTHETRSALEMSGFAMRSKGISQRIQSVSISAIKEMMHLALSYPDAISLAQGTPDFATPEHIRDRVKHELDHNPNVGKYAPLAGLPVLKEAIAEHLLSKRGIIANPQKELYVTMGAMEAIASAIMTIADSGDEVILLSPCFPSHITHTMLGEASPVYVRLDETRGWAFDINAFELAISPKTKAVVLCSPGNPTGNVLSEDAVRAIASVAEEHDFWVITDEPYDFLVYDDARFFSASQIPEIKNRLISCFSLSKEYAMTGWRIGYVYAEEGVINQMLKIHDAFAVSAATVSQYAALSALQGDQLIVEFFRDEFSRRRDLMCARLDRLSELFSYIKPGGAYYLFPKIIPETDEYAFAIRLLKEAGVVVVPGGAFGPGGEGHVRLCFAMSDDTINQAFDRIEKWNTSFSKTKL